MMVEYKCIFELCIPALIHIYKQIEDILLYVLEYRADNCRHVVQVSLLFNFSTRGAELCHSERWAAQV